MIELVLEAERAMSFGLLDQAERLYRQASEADPRNAIAVVGLAKVAIERGDEDEALALGDRALSIDPDNLAARRLVERLREIRAHRAGLPLPARSQQPVGDPVPRPSTPAPSLAMRGPQPAARSEPPPTPPNSLPTPAGTAASDETATPPPDAPAASAAAVPVPDPSPRGRRGILRRLLGRR